MDDNTVLVIVAALALTLGILNAKRIDSISREIDFIVGGDIETLKLKRKLDGYPKDDDG